MNKDKIKLLAILLGIVFPVLASTVFFMMKDGQGFGSTTNKGHLINPVVDVTLFDMRNAEGEVVYLPFDESVAGVHPEDYVPRPWGLIYLGDSYCDDSCLERVTYLRQLHIRLGAEVARVKRFYLNTGGMMDVETAERFAEEFPGMELSHTEAALSNVLAPTHPADEDPVDSHYIYVVDPVGNVMLYFTPENSPEDILSDVDKLLDQSSLG